MCLNLHSDPCRSFVMSSWVGVGIDISWLLAWKKPKNFPSPYHMNYFKTRELCIPVVGGIRLHDAEERRNRHECWCRMVWGSCRRSAPQALTSPAGVGQVMWADPLAASNKNKLQFFFRQIHTVNSPSTTIRVHTHWIALPTKIDILANRRRVHNWGDPIQKGM